MSQLKAPRLAFIFVLLVSLSFLFAPAGRTAHSLVNKERQPEFARANLPPETRLALIAEYHGKTSAIDKSIGRLSEKEPGGIRETHCERAGQSDACAGVE